MLLMHTSDATGAAGVAASCAILHASDACIVPTEPYGAAPILAPCAR